MREFRAWDTEWKQMHYHDWRDPSSQVHDLWQFVVALTDDSILLQYTGLKDKNRKKIYEGDIVRWDDGSNGAYWRVAEVFYDDSLAMFSFRIIDCINCNIEKGYVFAGNFMYRDGSQLEIIGNIYENPELLK